MKEDSIEKKVEQANVVEEVEDIVVTNCAMFQMKNNSYRVRKPNFKERSQVRKARTKKFYELLSEGVYKPKSVLSEELEKQGISIYKMERKLKQINKEIENLQIKLAPEKDTKSIELLRSEIIKLLEEQKIILHEMGSYFECCIETELVEYSDLYLLSLVLEKEEGDEYKRVFTVYEDLLISEDDEIIQKGIQNLSLIIYKNALQQ